MQDEELAKYVPKFGDRIAVVAYSKRQVSSLSSKDGHEKESSRTSLIERLKDKVCLGLMNPKGPHKRAKNKNAEKEQCRIELGWLNYDCKSRAYKQVRAPMGGGIIRLHVLKDTAISSLEEQAKQYFFPKGKNRQGRIEDFEFEENLWDCNHQPVDPLKTLRLLLDETKRCMIRLYLCSKQTGLVSSSSSDEDEAHREDDQSLPTMKSLKRLDRKRPINTLGHLDNQQPKDGIVDEVCRSESHPVRNVQSWKAIDKLPHYLLLYIYLFIYYYFLSDWLFVWGVGVFVCWNVCGVY